MERHQDEAYWSPKKNNRSISIWIPLQEATLENGCMQFIPGSHKLNILNHHSIDHNPRVQGLELDGDQADLSRAVACPLPPAELPFMEVGCSISHRQMSLTLREGHLSLCSTYPSRHRKRLATSIGKKASIHTRPKNGKQPIPDHLRHLLCNIQTEGEYR